MAFRARSHLIDMEEISNFVFNKRKQEKLKVAAEFPELAYEEGKYIVFCRSEMVCLKDKHNLLLKDFQAISEIKRFSRCIFLKVLEDTGTCLFAVNIENATDVELKAFEHKLSGKFVNVRQSMYFLDYEDSQWISHARGLIHFLTKINFCSFCGDSLRMVEGGFLKTCLKCRQIQYPNISPIGIALVDDDEHSEVLLVRQDKHPPGMFTCIAGYAEPGESLEENIKREVAEEVGVEVKNITYCASQHWALPSCQLTLGCIATATTKSYKIDKKELSDARWISAEDLKEAVTRKNDLRDIIKLGDQKIWAPPRNSVSFKLMEVWLIKYHGLVVSEGE